MKRLIVLLTATLLLTGCKKDDLDPDGLVKATQEGKNTGDFLLDGQPFSPRNSAGNPGSRPVGAWWYHRRNYTEANVALFRQDENRHERQLSLCLIGLRQPGTYRLIDSVNPYVVAGPNSYIVYERPTNTIAPRQYFVTGPQAPGQVIITRFDTVARVISGTFEAKLRDFDGPDSVQVAKGRFDCTF